LVAFGIRRLGMLICILRVLLGLGRVLLALDIVIPAEVFSSGPMGFCRGFVMFRRLVVCVFHFISPVGRQISAATGNGLNSGRMARQ
jgi:hypothetical protein